MTPIYGLCFRNANRFLGYPITCLIAYGYQPSFGRAFGVLLYEVTTNYA